MRALLADAPAELSPRIGALVEDLFEAWVHFDALIRAFDGELAAVARSDAAMRRFATVPGIGPMRRRS